MFNLSSASKISTLYVRRSDLTGFSALLHNLSGASKRRDVQPIDGGVHSDIEKVAASDGPTFHARGSGKGTNALGATKKFSIFVEEFKA